MEWTRGPGGRWRGLRSRWRVEGTKGPGGGNWKSRWKVEGTRGPGGGWRELARGPGGGLRVLDEVEGGVGLEVKVEGGGN